MCGTIVDTTSAVTRETRSGTEEANHKRILNFIRYADARRSFLARRKIMRISDPVLCTSSDDAVSVAGSSRLGPHSSAKGVV